VQLHDSIEKYYREGGWAFEKTERAVFDLCQRIDKYAHKLVIEDLEKDEYCSMIPDLSMDKVMDVIEATKQKMETGLKRDMNTVFLHTGPHHDDIMLGIFPAIIPQLREITNKFHFSVLTSGFNAVTNQMLLQLLKETLYLISINKIQMLRYDDFFESGYNSVGRM
jgi:glucosamine-6-phosphate deaminase